jgi:hypothetical protein
MKQERNSAYVIKWIPKDLDVVIDHTKRYDDPAEALAVARNLLQLNPKKICDLLFT